MEGDRSDQHNMHRMHVKLLAIRSLEETMRKIIKHHRGVKVRIFKDIDLEKSYGVPKGSPECKVEDDPSGSLAPPGDLEEKASHQIMPTCSLRECPK